MPKEFLLRPRAVYTYKLRVVINVGEIQIAHELGCSGFLI